MTSQDSHLPFSQFVEFMVDPRHQAGLVTALNERFERFTRTYPGFIRASVHVSEDQQRVLSHVLWQSKSDCEKAFENAEQGEGDLWGLIRAHRTTAMTFNAYELVSETVGPR
jgi:heme-degrading monooxygenase HmoA